MFRSRHLACLLLLLSALGAAGAATSTTQALSPAGRYIHALLCCSAASTQAGSALLRSSCTQGADSLRLALVPAAHAAVRTPWTMRTPAAQTTAVHAVTGLARG